MHVLITKPILTLKSNDEFELLKLLFLKDYLHFHFRRSTRPEVAQVQLVNSTDGTCAQTAIVSAISKTSHQMTTVVLAENKGVVLKRKLCGSKM